MSEGAISVRDIENLFKSFEFMSQNFKWTLLEMIKNELASVNVDEREFALRNMHNIYSIVGKFSCEELFKSGRITFRDDNELIFDTIVGTNTRFTEMTLFEGCTLAKGDGSTYILLNNAETPSMVKKICKSYNFDKLVRDAIMPPQISILINIGYYPSQIEGILQLIRQ